jgi:hypothetical protein
LSLIQKIQISCFSLQRLTIFSFYSIIELLHVLHLLIVLGFS